MKFLFVSFFLFSGQYAIGHRGGLNSQGCHGGSRPYHCHRSSSSMVKSSYGGYRLRCNLGSRSKDCMNRSNSLNIGRFARDKQRIITRTQYGTKWPFTVNAGLLRCDRGSAVIFIYNKTKYALSGIAKSYASRRGYRNIQFILKNHPSKYKQKTNIDSLIHDGLKLCK